MLLLCKDLFLAVKLCANVTNYCFCSYSGISSTIVGMLLING